MKKDDGQNVLIIKRVSTVQQSDGVSLDVQEEECRKILQGLDVKIKSEIVLQEIESGASKERPILEEAKRLVIEKKVDVVVAYDTDRIARDALIPLLFARLCQESGVALHFADGTSVESELDEVQQFLKGWAAGTERRRIMARTMDAKMMVARKGRYPCGMGRGCYAYDVNPVTGERIVNEAEAEVVRLIFSLRAGGMPVHRIAKLLNERGIPTKHGCKWESRPVRAILMREAYVGRQFYGMARHVKISSKKRISTPKPREEWVLVEGWSEAIVEEPVWNLVQSMWGTPQRQSVTKVRNYCLTGLLECGECGCGMGGRSEKQRWAYYLCPATRDNAKRDRYCTRRGQIRAGETEDAVKGCLTEVLMSPDGIVAELREHLGTGGGNLGEEIKRLRREIGQHVSELKSYARQLARKKIEEKYFDELVAPVNVLLAKRRETLAGLEEQQKLRDHEAEMEQKLLACFAQYAIGLDELDGDGWHALMRMLGVKVIATDDELLVMATLDPGLFTIEHTSALRRGRSCRSRPTGIRRGWMNWLPRWQFCRGPARLRYLAGTAR